MYTTLVMSAANMHGLMYVGALRYLSETERAKHIHTVIGASAGAIVGFMFCIGLTSDEIANTVCNILCNVGLPCVSLTKMLSAWSALGVLGGQWKKEYLRLLLKKKFQRSDVNFSDFAKLTGKDFVVVGSNITQNRAEYFSVESTPNMSVLEALDITSCIPVVFKPILYKDCLYVDGGVYNYLPTDRATDAAANVLVLYCPMNGAGGSPPKNLYQFVRDIMASLIYLKYGDNALRFPTSIPLLSKESSASVDTVSLRQRIVTLPREHVQRLFAAGYDQTATFFGESEGVVAAA